ncbi:MAG TPA: MmgE/PrpD family protein [Thermoleophilaceae bacterium]|nr:MmgE/PrpD family protein [Thermoleophilaceae bacterium]
MSEALFERLAGWGSSLDLDDVPPRVAAFAKSQVLSQLAAARAGLGHELGEKLVRAFGHPLQEDPKRAAYVLAALTAALDFDDTVYAGHVTHSTVNVPLAHARALDLDGRTALTAILAANECAARVTAAATLGSFRGQTAAHAHLAGGVVARLRAEGAPAPTWVNALGIAFAAPPWALTRAFFGSDAKVLTGATPVRVALDACDAAAAGLTGAADLLEHPDGFLAKFASVPLPEAAVAGLGERWHTETASLKCYPGSAYVSACVDCAVELHGQLNGASAGDVAEVVVHGSVFTLGMQHRTQPYLDGSGSSAVAINFSVPYNVATALLTGGLSPADLAPPRVDEPDRWDLAGRVRLEHDDELTKRAVLATAPLGEALREAGPRVEEWVSAAGAGEQASAILDELGPPSPDFSEAEKAIGARITVRLADGRELVAERDIALGAAGPDTRARHAELMREKFAATGGPPDAADAFASLERLSAGELADALRQALSA